MSELRNIQVEKRDGVFVVRIARPEVLNALSADTLAELRAAFEAFDADPTLGAALLTGGEGGKRPAFAAGADIAEMARMSGLELRDHARHGQRALDAIDRCSKPVIAAINGFALGGGLELAMACHIRYAAAGARMGQPEINLGIIPGFGGSQRLPRLIGKGRALEMLLGGDPVDAARALELGLVDRVLPDAELFDAAFALAAKLAGKAPVARRLILDAVVRGLDVNLDDGLRLEADLFGVVGATEDVKEGLTAFLDKRAATFRGK
ncbi:MAG: enoyl-CoA hydratase/isomerase family protein [Planctomycetes bacterium]|nr:enoyl-CoA hydratase/isomerase family protein [Planctomycetota bacterium]